MVVVPCPATPAATVTTAGLAFSPAMTTISVGDILEFVPVANHTMTSNTGEFDTPVMVDTCLQFNTAGSYPFHCAVHASMTGTITVN